MINRDITSPEYSKTTLRLIKTLVQPIISHTKYGPAEGSKHQIGFVCRCYKRPNQQELIPAVDEWLGYEERTAMLAWLFAGGKKMKSKACAAANYFSTPAAWDNLTMLGRTITDGARYAPHLVSGAKDTYEEDLEKVFGARIPSYLHWITLKDDTNYSSEM